MQTSDQKKDLASVFKNFKSYKFEIIYYDDELTIKIKAQVKEFVANLWYLEKNFILILMVVKLNLGVFLNLGFGVSIATYTINYAVKRFDTKEEHK